MVPKSIKIKYILFFTIFRLFSVFIVQTYFVPDEFWQSLEVAHKFSFGYGYLTWEWQHGLRNCAYPLVISLLFGVLKWLSLDSLLLLIHLPRLLQALSVTVGDLFILNLCHKQHGNAATKWTAFLLATSWFMFYCSPRTIINTTEMVLTSIGLALYPWQTADKNGRSINYLFVVSLLCLIRPTATILWLPLFFWHFITTGEKFILFLKTVVISLFSLPVTLLIDSYCYGRIVFSPYNFFLYNWTKDIGTFYGTHSWHWYFTQGCPVVLGFHLIPFVLGLKRKYLWPKYLLILWTVLVLSLIGHKEFRFLLPVLPLICYVCGVSIHSLRGTKWKSLKKLIVLSLLVTNIPVALYFSIVHQRGVLDAMQFIQNEALQHPSMRVLFLLPCHSTPYYSHVHRNISMRFLTCEPNVMGIENYTDEADIFYKDPVKWMQTEFASDRLPSHVVVFDNIFDKFIEVVGQKYKECFKAFHTHFSSDRIGNFIHICCHIL